MPVNPADAPSAEDASGKTDGTAATAEEWEAYTDEVLRLVAPEEPARPAGRPTGTPRAAGSLTPAAERPAEYPQVAPPRSADAVAGAPRQNTEPVPDRAPHPRATTETRKVRGASGAADAPAAAGHEADSPAPGAAADQGPAAAGPAAANSQSGAGVAGRSGGHVPAPGDGRDQDAGGASGTGAHAASPAVGRGAVGGGDPLAAGRDEERFGDASHEARPAAGQGALHEGFAEGREELSAHRRTERTEVNTPSAPGGATALGAPAGVSAPGETALGASAAGSAPGETALGASAAGSAPGETALGAPAGVSAPGETALGASAAGSAPGETALGASATASAPGETATASAPGETADGGRTPAPRAGAALLGDPHAPAVRHPSAEQRAAEADMTGCTPSRDVRTGHGEGLVGSAADESDAVRTAGFPADGEPGVQAPRTWAAPKPSSALPAPTDVIRTAESGAPGDPGTPAPHADTVRPQAPSPSAPAEVVRTAAPSSAHRDAPTARPAGRAEAAADPAVSGAHAQAQDEVRAGHAAAAVGGSRAETAATAAHPEARTGAVAGARPEDPRPVATGTRSEEPAAATRVGEAAAAATPAAPERAAAEPCAERLGARPAGAAAEAAAEGHAQARRRPTAVGGTPAEGAATAPRSARPEALAKPTNGPGTGGLSAGARVGGLAAAASAFAAAERAATPAAGSRAVAGAPAETHGRASDEVRAGRRTAAVEPHLAGPAWGARAERAEGLATVAAEGPPAEARSVGGGTESTPEAALGAAVAVGLPGGQVRAGGGAGGQGHGAAAPVADDDTQDLPRVGAGVPGPGIASGRHLIGSPGATAIPVHLLFRDQGAGAGSVPGPVVGAGPVAGGAARRSGGALDARTAADTGTAPGTRTAPGARTAPATRAPAPAPRHGSPTRPPVPPRTAPPADPALSERRGPAVPGWAGVLAGVGAAAGAALVGVRAGLVPGRVADALGVAAGAAPTRYHWAALAALGVVALVALGGLGRGRAGHAWVLTLFGSYRGTVRRTGLVWVSPMLLRRRVDVRLRHWRSEPMPAVDAGGLALRVVVHVVWRVKDTARAALAVEDHTDYLAEQVESAMARVLSRLPADAFHEDAPTLRDAEAVGDALTRMLAADTEVAGIEVYSAQPTRIEYAPEVAAAMRRRRVAAIDAKHRDAVLNSVVDAVDDTVNRLTSRGLVELDDYERKALVKDLTVAFYTGRQD